jgi:hypothetical protein
MVWGMTRLLRMAAVAVLVGGATAVLTSCSNDPGPLVTTTPSVPATAEPVTTPSPTPSAASEKELLEQIPENARGEDFISATNFALFFLNEYPEILTGPQPELFDLLSDENCIFCDNVAAALRESIGPGDTVRGGDITSLQTIADGGLQEDGTWSISFDMNVADLEIVDSSGTIVDTDEGGDGRTTVLLEYDKHWIVLGVGGERS